MKRVLLATLATAAITAVMSTATLGTASAQLARALPTVAVQSDAGVLTPVQWRGRGGYYRGGRGYGGGAVLGGLAAGAIIGGAIASQNGYYYNRPGYVYEEEPVYEAEGGGNSEAYCRSRYKSYDPGSGTYLGYDGLRHPC
jgi:hypothetical protein